MLAQVNRYVPEFIQTSWPYQKLAEWGTNAKSLSIRVLDYVLPKNPVTERREFRVIPTSVENFIGKLYYEDACPSYKIAKDYEYSENIQQIFVNLINKCDRPELDFELRIMEDHKVVNAFCLPGGKVVITTALLNKLQEKLEDSEKENAWITFNDKVAAVLGHEIAHACAGHGALGIQLSLFLGLLVKVCGVAARVFVYKSNEEQLERARTHQERRENERKIEVKANLAQTFVELTGRITSYLYTLHHSREHEFEADRYGMHLTNRAGYNFDASIWLQLKFLEIKGETVKTEKGFWERTTDLFSTHPPSQDRLNKNLDTADSLVDENNNRK